MRRAGVPVARPDAGKSDFRSDFWSDVNRTSGPLGSETPETGDPDKPARGANHATQSVGFGLY